MKKVLLTLFLLIGFCSFVFAFNSVEEKLEAKVLISRIPDEQVKKDLLYNIANGNLETLEDLKNAIENYLETEADRYYARANLDLGSSEAVSLKEKLHEILINHVCLGYSKVRKLMYGKFDNKNGIVEGVYTGKKFDVTPIYITVIIRSEDSVFSKKEVLECSDAVVDSRFDKEKGFLNCEHTWPQSFFNKKEPMRSDAFHLFPTDSDANSRRGSYPFGEVKEVIWSQGGSKLGYDEKGRIVFEPRDKQKGNTARAMFYFSTCYGYSIDQDQERVLRKWHEMDPPDLDEKMRNEIIYEYQKNRNPFIDHPEFVEQIKDF